MTSHEVKINAEPPGPVPAKCPVCEGTGTKRWAFYEPGLLGEGRGDLVTCRTCDGDGIVWPPSAHQPEPYVIPQPYPIYVHPQPWQPIYPWWGTITAGPNTSTG